MSRSKGQTESPVVDEDEPFALTRRFAFVSLAGILAAAVTLAVLYRDLAIRSIIEFGERNNVTVATLSLSVMLHELDEYFPAGKHARENGFSVAELAKPLALIKASLLETPVERLKVYDRDGIVLYSTREQDIGTDESTNVRFQAAIRGEVRSRFRYRDVFRNLGGGHGDENLMETYLPIRRPGDPQPIGVFELYTDVQPIVDTMTRNGLVVLLSIAAIMAVLYGVLLYVVRRSEKIISSQRETILQRNKTLQTLSARVLDADESERGRVAWELHEEIAQTLSAAKARVELLGRDADQHRSKEDRVSSDEIVTLVQNAIGDVRALAMDLRPPVLDDFGLVAAILLFCREEKGGGRQLDAKALIDVREEDVPERLKAVICRVVQQTLKGLAGYSGVSDICVALEQVEQSLRLTVEFNADTGETDQQAKPASVRGEWPITDVWARAVLSGGAFDIMRAGDGRSLYRATWPVRREDGLPRVPGTTTVEGTRRWRRRSMPNRIG